MFYGIGVGVLAKPSSRIFPDILILVSCSLGAGSGWAGLSQAKRGWVQLVQATKLKAWRH